MLLPEVPRLGAYTIQANVVGRGTGTCHHRLETSVPSMNVADALTQCPHNDRTPAEPRVRALCTRAVRGCPAGLPGRARGAAQTVPDLTPPSWNRGGEVRNAAKRVRSGQQGRTKVKVKVKVKSGYGRPPASNCHAPRGTRQHGQQQQTRKLTLPPSAPYRRPSATSAARRAASPGTRNSMRARKAPGRR